jgi:hypothetical protein
VSQLLLRPHPSHALPFLVTFGLLDVGVLGSAVGFFLSHQPLAAAASLAWVLVTGGGIYSYFRLAHSQI